jgi:hypothetical protein
MPKITWNRTDKQTEAWRYLTDDITTELLFGGGAGGAKTFFGCAWLIIMCGRYPGTRWLMGRTKLKTLKQTTLNTFFDICSMWGIKNDVDYKYNGMSGVITWTNGSEILLKDLYQYPADPNFDSLGSLEISGAFIDEANQITVKAKGIVLSRIRYRLDEYGLIPKMLLTCNPAKNWVYQDFYKPDLNKTLPEHRKFIQALAKDNPFISKHYIINLRKLDKHSKERLLFGNWEYDDDPSALFDINVISDLFTNIGYFPKETIPVGYLTVDVARMGRDKTVITRWLDLQAIEITTIAKSKLNELNDILDTMEKKHKIRRSHQVIDEDGVGGGVVDYRPGCIGFVNNSRAIQPQSESRQKNYANLKTQCYFKLAELAIQGKVGITCSDDVRDLIVEELEQVKQRDIDKDGKIALVGKEHIKEAIGRSPDYADSLMLRMRLEIKGSSTTLTPMKTGSIIGNVMQEKF